MTEQDLATILRTHLSEEPPFNDNAAAAVVERGRRAVRRRRLAVAGGGIAACTLAAAMIVPELVGLGAVSDQAIDPEIATAINAYDVATMPRTMDERARLLLERSVPDLGSADFVAFDAQYQRLPEKYWEKASGLFVRYDLNESHLISVTLSHARSEAEGDAERFCDLGVEAGHYVECDVTTSGGGDVVISSLEADTMWKQRNESSLQGWKDQFSVVPQDTIGSVPVDELWFTRTVKVIKSDTFVTYVTEQVQAADLDAAREQLVVPLNDLEAIGLDHALVMPKPPAGENGCPQWTMPTPDSRVSCMGAN